MHAANMIMKNDKGREFSCLDNYYISRDAELEAMSNKITCKGGVSP